MSDYYALSYEEKKVLLERFEVSSQGVSKLISWHRWNLKNSSRIPLFFCDNELNEIWASHGSKVWCLRTNGQNQEVNDHSLRPNPKTGGSLTPKSALIVGKGEICLFGNPKEYYHLRFDEDGYRRLDGFDFKELNGYIEEGDFEVVLHQHHHPELSEQYVLVGKKSRNFGVYYVYYNGQVTSAYKDNITNFEELFGWLEDESSVSIGNEMMTINWGSSPKYVFSSDAVKLGRYHISQLKAVAEIGNSNPRPRYPMTHAQKTFEEDIRARLELHESILREEFSDYFGHS